MSSPVKITRDLRIIAPANAPPPLAAGIPDAPMQVYYPRLRGETTYRSFHAMADHTFRENAQTPVKRARWVAHPDGPQQYQAAPKQGVIAPSGTPVDAGGPMVSAG